MRNAGGLEGGRGPPGVAVLGGGDKGRNPGST